MRDGGVRTFMPFFLHLFHNFSLVNFNFGRVYYICFLFCNYSAANCLVLHCSISVSDLFIRSVMMLQFLVCFLNFAILFFFMLYVWSLLINSCCFLYHKVPVENFIRFSFRMDALSVLSASHILCSFSLPPYLFPYKWKHIRLLRISSTHFFFFWLLEVE